MSEIERHCETCRALLDEEDLFCGTCGTATSTEQDLEREAPGSTTAQTFDCSGCGASMVYDASVKTLSCPFCGSSGLTEQPHARGLLPRYVVPFQINREQATANLRSWLGQGFWRPGDLAQAATVDAMSAVLVPYWVFSGTTHTYWTADTNQTPPLARASWYPVTGEYIGTHRGVLVAASSVLTADETNQLSPFDLATSVAAEQVNYEGTIVERFCVPRKHARPLAQSGLESLDRMHCARHVPGAHRNLRTNTRVENLSSEPVLLPVWVLAYRYRHEVHRFLMNGQTGQAIGTAPIDYWKVGAFIAGGIVLLLLFLLLAVSSART